MLYKKITGSTVAIVLWLTIVIGIVEFLVMLMLQTLMLPFFAHAIVDSLIPVVFVSPLLYLYIAKRKKAEHKGKMLYKKITGSTTAAVLWLTIVIGIVEFLVMLMLQTLTLPFFAYAIVDSLILVVLVSPVLYLYIAKRKKAEQAEHKLNGRVKELTCLYGISRIRERADITLDELYQKAANLLPKSWQYPEITCARIVLNDKKFETENYKETKWKQSSDIKVYGAKAGIVEVNYLEERPELDEGPFLKEERMLIDAVAERLGEITDLKRMEHVLNERVKELTCLYSIARIDERPGIILDELYQEIANLLPKSWQYPEITCACIVLNDKKFSTENCKETKWKQSSDIKVHGVRAGIVEVCYSEERPEIDEGPFLKEERLLIDAVAKQLGNITERKQAEEALKESEQKFRSIFDNARDGIALTDTETKQFYLGNKRICKMLGYSLKELKNLRIMDIHPKKDLPYIMERFERRARGEMTLSTDIPVIRKDGSVFYTEVNSALITLSGKKLLLGIFRDITERKQAEEEIKKKNEQLEAQNEELQLQSEELTVQQQELLEKSQEVEEASQAKSEFLASMSHELRTPLNVIIGFSQLMSDRVPGEVNEEQRQCLEDILSSGEHLLNLVNDILDLSKVESGKVELRLRNTALTNVIESLRSTIMPMLAQREQSLDVSLEEGLPLVHVDEARVRQVLLNLLGNASKFTPDGGKLEVRAVSKGDWCQVSVIDNGIGIEKKDQERIFEAFHRVDNAGVREGDGTGLGLTITKQIIETHHGRIWVESEYGKGSKFMFTLPLAPKVNHAQGGERVRSK